MTGEFYEESRNKSSDYADRYKNCPVYTDIDTGEILISSREDLSIPNRGRDVYHRIESHESSRLDLLAQKYYRNPLLWWVIAQANEIYDPLTPVPPGTLLRIPDIESLYGNNGALL